MKRIPIAPFASSFSDCRIALVTRFHFRILVLFMSLNFSALTNPVKAEGVYAIAIHGGAGGMPSADVRPDRLRILNDLLDEGMAMLESGDSALDVVEAIIRQLEDSELFNAGRGCVLNDLGEHELDASIMNGRDLACGAVAGVKSTRYPITLARKVMTETRHVLLSGPGADEFGRVLGLEQADAAHFVTERQRQRYLRWKRASTGQFSEATKLLGDKSSTGQAVDEQSYYGTVGCVVLDKNGDLAAGTSTGGLLGKRWGRIGDSPIIGAGNYADNSTCAVSGTGIGEEFIRHAVASDIAARMRYAGAELESACQDSMARLPEDCGGVICVDNEGHVLARHNTPAMAYALANSHGIRQIQLYPNKQHEAPLEGSE